LISINGQVVIEQDKLNVNDVELSVENIEKGMYLLRVQSENNEV